MLRVLFALIGAMFTVSAVSSSLTRASSPNTPASWAMAPVLSSPRITAPQAATPVSAQTNQEILTRYCAGCHNERAKAGGLALTTLDIANVGPHAETWERVVRKLRAGLMPPAGRPRPDKATYDRFLSSLEDDLDSAAAADLNPGRTEPTHRLNRTEYQNAIRDLLGVEMDVASLLPADDVSYGFDNIAGVLRMSPTLMERYLSVVKKVARAAVGSPPPFPSFDVFRMADDAAQDDRLEGLPFGTRGGALIRYNFPVDGEYVLRARLARQTGAQDLDVPRYQQPQELEVSVDGQPLTVFTLAASEPSGEEDDEAPRRPRGQQVQVSPAEAPAASTTESVQPVSAPAPEAPPAAQPAARRRSRGDGGRRGTLDADWELRFRAKAGPRDVGVTFLTRSPALLETLVEPYLRPWNVGSNQWSSRRGAYVRSVEISGPFDVTGVSETPSRQRIFTCRPAGPAEEVGCAKTILSTLARRAYRRPITETDVQELLTFYESGRADGGFEQGVEFALQRLLMSPNFLFRTELDPPNLAPNTSYRISDLELASRLSFFLWSSIPDEKLLAAAEKGTLKDRGVLDAQVRRMLADPRSRAISTNFAGQWLYLRNVPSLTRDPEKDPDFDHGLRRAFREETELFFDHLLREDRSVLELLTADYTFVNERLAKHYGVPGVAGTHFRRVTHVSPERRGLLGHGSILAVTSYPNRTSPVIRGKWILENLLGTPPPPPPPNVPDLEEPEKGTATLTLRQRIEEHRANPVCASCHNLMDPLGFALENFDAAGRLRPVDETFSPIDTSGVFPDGTKIDGPASLRQALLNHSDSLVNTVIEKLLTYALGRGVEYYDAPAMRKIARDAEANDNRLTSLILGVVNSAPFQMRRSQS